MRWGVNTIIGFVLVAGFLALLAAPMALIVLFPGGAEHIATECLAIRVRLLGRTITRIYDDALRPLGLTVGQLNLLVFVGKRGPVGPGELASVLGMEKSTVSRNVERMIRQGWIDSSPSSSGRGQELSLTAQGRKLLEKAVPLWEEAQRQTTETLGERNFASLRRITNSVWARLARE